MALSLYNFVQLLLVMIAKDSEENIPEQTDKVTIRIPFNYRERIENILCAGNGWKEKFSVLIDTEDYFKDHFWWEERLSREILNVVKQLDKSLQFDLVNEQISLVLYSTEVDSLFSNFKDKEIIARMKHFASLLTCRIYSRIHQEEFTDYTARSRKMMHDLLQREYRRGLEDF